MKFLVRKAMTFGVCLAIAVVVMLNSGGSAAALDSPVEEGLGCGFMGIGWGAGTELVFPDAGVKATCQGSGGGWVVSSISSGFVGTYSNGLPLTSSPYFGTFAGAVINPTNPTVDPAYTIHKWILAGNCYDGLYVRNGLIFQRDDKVFRCTNGQISFLGYVGTLGGLEP